MKEIEQFNKKYEDYLETGHYGLDIQDAVIIEYLDKQFEDLIKIPGFKYSQIKLKFNSCRFYNNLHEILPTIGSQLSDKVEEFISNYFLILYKKVIEDKKQEVKEPRIVLNRIKTPDGTILTSFSTHDYIEHHDANGQYYAVDGGNSYLKRVFDVSDYTELSVYENDTFEKIRESFHRGGRGKLGNEELTWIPMNKMNNNWLQACIVYNAERGLKDSFASKMYQKELDYRKENNIFINE